MKDNMQSQFIKLKLNISDSTILVRASDISIIQEHHQKSIITLNTGKTIPVNETTADIMRKIKLTEPQ